MIVALIVVGSLLWLWSGASGILYWWKYEFGDTDGAPWYIVALLGPLAWPIGYFIHGVHGR